MKFQDSQVELRLRTPDEAVDVGILLARKYWWALLGGWAVIAVPFFCIGNFIPSTFWALIFFWWFKPLYERIPLHIISTSIFQYKFSLQATLRGIFQYDTLAWLTIFRVCPGRSTLTPVAALEGLPSGTGKIRRRRQIVKSPIVSTYFLLHVGMFVCEFIITLMGLILYMKFFEPVADETLFFFQIMGKQWQWVWESASGQILLLSLLFASSALFAPFYVCAGFGLYINRRIGLEGWDLYLSFQRLVTRLGVVCLALLILLPSVEMIAQYDSEEITATNTPQKAIRMEIEEIIQEKIVTERTVRQLKTNPIESHNSWDWIMQWLSYLIIFLLLLFLGGLIIWAAIKLRIWEFVTRRTQTTRVAESENSMITLESSGHDIPSNVAVEANIAWRQGRARDALSLLYRGALLYLRVIHACAIEVSDTERRCARVVSRQAPSLSDVFNTLSSNWQQVAYGKKELETSEFKELVSIYEDSFA